MVLHFAYGSNMSRKLMHARCPSAVALGVAQLANWRFVITRDGFASLVSEPGAVVHGVLWQLSARDLTAVNAYEGLDVGLYRRRILPVRFNGQRRSALIYLGRSSEPGRPRPAYLDVVIEAARDWLLPDEYIDALTRWSSRRHARGAVERKNFA